MPTAPSNSSSTTRRHGGAECKPLLDAATKDIFRNNAFRITGLAVDATPREINKHAVKLQSMAELGLGEEAHKATFARKPPPTLDEIREAIERLKDPEKRLIDEFFWVWPEEFGRSQADAAVQAFAAGDGETAFQIWQLKETNPASGTTAMHNLAIAFHLAALEWENQFLLFEVASDQRTQVEQYWKKCFKRWERLAVDDSLWDMVAARIRQIDDARLTTGFARRMRASLPEALDKINAELALAFAKAGKLELARIHIQFMRETNEGLDNVEKTAELVLNPVKARLHEQIQRAKRVAEEDPAQANEAARSLLEHALPLIEVFDLFFGEQERVEKELFDEVATTSIHCLVAYQRKTSDNRTFVELLQKTLPLADSLEIRKRIEENIAIGNGNLAFAALAPIHAVCEAAAKATEANPDAGQKEAERILSAASDILSTISSSGLPQEALNQANDEVALALMHCAVVFGNKTEQWKSCLPILEQSLRLAVSAAVRARVTKNLETVRKNSVLYADLTPISSAPSLSTISGIGLTLYGCTDRDPTTGSYLATYYFVFLGIPIFPICRYRVASNDNAYRFFGKAPLRTFDKWHLAISIGLILSLIVAIDANSDAPAPSSPSTYTPPSSYGVPQTTPRNTYRIPSSMSSELRRDKEAVEAQRTKASALANEVDRLASAIDSDRLLLDPTSQYGVDEFNRKVALYNAKVEAARAQSHLLNQMVDAYNDKLQRYGR